MYLVWIRLHWTAKHKRSRHFKSLDIFGVLLCSAVLLFCFFQFLPRFSYQEVRSDFSLRHNNDEAGVCRVSVVGSLHWLSHFSDLAWAQGSSSGLGAVVEAKNITLAAGSTAVLPCHSPRMVWTSDRLKDRQRVVHWDLVRSSPDYSTERILDMSPGGRQRVYNSINKGRISIPDSAFNDGYFSLMIDSETFSAFPGLAWP